jgi:hypothetical protein
MRLARLCFPTVQPKLVFRLAVSPPSACGAAGSVPLGPATSNKRLKRTGAWQSRFRAQGGAAAD